MQPVPCQCRLTFPHLFARHCDGPRFAAIIPLFRHKPAGHFRIDELLKTRSEDACTQKSIPICQSHGCDCACPQFMNRFSLLSDHKRASKVQEIRISWTVWQVCLREQHLCKAFALHKTWPTIQVHINQTAGSTNILYPTFSKLKRCRGKCYASYAGFRALTCCSTSQ